MCSEHFVSAIIVSAGNSSRMGGVNKQFLEIDGVPVVARTVEAFEVNKSINEILIVTRESDVGAIKKLVSDFGFKKVNNIVVGGSTRQQSVYNGVINTSDKTDFVLIHDGARPLVTQRVIDLSVEKAFESGSSAVGVKVKDTVKQVDSDNNIVATTDRSCLRFIQTPQVFNKELYLFAVSSAKEGIEYTDDCMLLEACGKTVSFVEGDYENIKITTPEDVELAVNYLKKRGK